MNTWYRKINVLILAFFLSVVFTATSFASFWDNPGITTYSNSVQVKQDKQARTDNQAVYLGFAPLGAATSSNVWLVKYLQYDGTGFLTSITTAVDVNWDDRTSHTYK